MSTFRASLNKFLLKVSLEPFPGCGRRGVCVVNAFCRSGRMGTAMREELPRARGWQRFDVELMLLGFLSGVGFVTGDGLL